jgi:ComF family protein
MADILDYISEPDQPDRSKLFTKFSIAELAKVASKFMETCKYLLFQERCRVCAYFIHPEIAGMDHNSFRPPAHYRFGDKEIFSDCLCQPCGLSVRCNQPICDAHERVLEDGEVQRLLVASGTKFVGEIKKVIYKFKYDQDLLLTKDLALLIFDAWQKLDLPIDLTLARIVPVPLHWTRLRERGFNQSELIARYWASLVGIKVVTNALKRTKKTASQQELGKWQRQTNVIDAFKANAKLVAGKQIILVDDVCTSGATLLECAKTLQEAGAASIIALTIATVDL